MFGWDRRGRVETGLFDDLVGAGEDRWRDCQAERLGGFEIDHQLEGRRLLDRQISGFCAVEDFCGVNAGQAKGGGEARSITDQAAGYGEFTQRIDHRYGMACCQCDELLLPTV